MASVQYDGYALVRACARRCALPHRQRLRRRTRCAACVSSALLSERMETSRSSERMETSRLGLWRPVAQSQHCRLDSGAAFVTDPGQHAYAYSKLKEKAC